MARCEAAVKSMAASAATIAAAAQTTTTVGSRRGSRAHLTRQILLQVNNGSISSSSW